jgi:HAMP domain-containing protein
LRIRARSVLLRTMTSDHRLEAAKKALRHKLRDASGDVPVPAADLRAVLDELGRLQQSNDRLRRQNRRVRLKLQRAGIADDTAEAPEAGDDAENAP